MKKLFRPRAAAPISLRRMLLNYISGPILIILSAMFIIFLVTSYFLTRSILATQDGLLHGVSGQIELFLDETSLLVESLSDATEYLNRNQIFTTMENLREKYPRFQAFYILDSEGVVVVESVDQPWLLGLDLSGEEFFKKIPGMETRFSDPFVSLLTDQVVVTLATPIQWQTGSPQGVLGAELNLELLQQNIENLEREEASETFVIDAKGVYIAHPEIKYVEQRDYFSPQPIIVGEQPDRHEFQIYLDEETGSWKIASIAKLDIGWTIISQRSLGNVMMPIYLEVGIMLVALVLVSIGFWLNIKTASSKSLIH